MKLMPIPRDNPSQLSIQVLPHLCRACKVSAICLQRQDPHEAWALLAKLIMSARMPPALMQLQVQVWRSMHCFNTPTRALP